jgi:hypothetical protein
MGGMAIRRSRAFLRDRPLRGFGAQGIDQIICSPDTVAGRAGFATVLAALDRG